VSVKHLPEGSSPSSPTNPTASWANEKRIVMMMTLVACGPAYFGESYNGNTLGSEPINEGSIPSSPSNRSLT
jgi:hypothetical protein